MRFFLLMTLFSAALAEPAYSQTRVKVVDQDNQPLPNAVVEYTIPSFSAQPLSTQASSKQHIYIMDQINKQFEPHVLIIPKNSFVSFPNSDDIRHHVYSFSEAKTFELKLYAGKPKNPVLFNNAGIVIMGCNIHDAMVGYIYVSSNNMALLSDSKGEIVFPFELTHGTELKIWHPNSVLGESRQIAMTMTQSMLKKNSIVLTVATQQLKARDSFEALNHDEH